MMGCLSFNSNYKTGRFKRPVSKGGSNLRYIKRDDSAIQNSGDVLACRYYHTIRPEGWDAIGDCGALEIDGKDWDVFHVRYETKDAYYGIPMLGMGLMDCMILKKDTRPFTKDDKLSYSLGICGILSDNPSHKYDVEIEPIVDKL